MVGNQKIPIGNPPMAPQGAPMVPQGAPMAPRGAPMAPQGFPMAPRGAPKGYPWGANGTRAAPTLELHWNSMKLGCFWHPKVYP